jgi:hypothetical protein
MPIGLSNVKVRYPPYQGALGAQYQSSQNSMNTGYFACLHERAEIDGEWGIHIYL